MSQLATIFEKIKEDFFTTQVENEKREEYELIFSPFSTGFTQEDFLFLDTNNASRDANKYLDELYQFSIIANTIPRKHNFWLLSGDPNDYLFNSYKNIINRLKLMDPETLTIDMFYGHPLFLKALDLIRDEQKTTYRSFFDLNTKLTHDIAQLSSSVTEANKTMVELEIRMKEDNLVELNGQWRTEGKKDEIETEILDIIKDEFNAFMRRFIDIKAKLETSIKEDNSTSSSYYVTSCTPNNLYQSDELDWKKIAITRQELMALLERSNQQGYENLFGKSELSKLEIEAIDFELIFLTITRAWYDESLLHSPFWDITVLNKEEIDIPKVSSKLIFIRNLSIKPKENSQQNKILFEKNEVPGTDSNNKSLGPFMINMNHLKLGQSLKPQSVNKALKIDRKIVWNVNTKLNENQKNQKRKKQRISVAITKKQNQFIALAPKLKTKRAVKAVPVKTAKTPVKVLPFKVLLSAQAMATVATIKVKCRFNFIDAVSKEIISPDKVNLFLRNNEVSPSIQNRNTHHAATLAVGTDYKMIIEKEGYHKSEYHFKTTGYNEKTKGKQFRIALTKLPIQDEPTESFQLIGVIAKNIAPFPNPIEKAEYL